MDSWLTSLIQKLTKSPPEWALQICLAFRTKPCKPMMTLPAINTDASKHEKELISRTVQEMFEEAEFWLVSE